MASAISISIAAPSRPFPCDPFPPKWFHDDLRTAASGEHAATGCLLHFARSAMPSLAAHAAALGRATATEHAPSHRRAGKAEAIVQRTRWPSRERDEAEDAAQHLRRRPTGGDARHGYLRRGDNDAHANPRVESGFAPICGMPRMRRRFADRATEVRQ